MSRCITKAFAAITLLATGSIPVSAQQPQSDKPMAVVNIATSRFNDIMWENDRAAFRIYSRDLETSEPPSSSGIDAWGKKGRIPFMVRQLGRNYHDDSGEGLDFYSVGTSRGAGGLGIWYDNKLWTSRNYARRKILSTGGNVASFEVGYAPWPVDVVRKVWENRRFTLPMGTNFTRMVSTIGSDTRTPLVVGIGIAKYSTSRTPGKLTVDKATGLMSVWSDGTQAEGAMGVAIRVDPAAMIDVRQDSDNYIVLIKVQPGRPFVYYTGSGWSKGADFHSREDWERYARSETVNFAASDTRATPKRR